MRFWEPGLPIKSGDELMITVTHHRKFWQFWKPRKWTTQQKFYAKPGEMNYDLIDERGHLLEFSVSAEPAVADGKAIGSASPYGKIHTDGSRSGGQPI